MEEAARHYHEGDFVVVAQACLDIVAAEPRHFDALHLLGVVLQCLGKTADSAAILTRALWLRPDDAGALHNIAVAWLHLGLYGDAGAAALQAAQYDGTNPDLLNTLALALLGLGRAEDAAHLLRQVAAHFPGHAPSRYTLGQACVELGLLDAAALQFEALLTGPLDAFRATDIANALANIRLEQGAPAAALALLRTVRTRWPDARTDWNESLALLTLGQYAEGWAKYEARWTEPLHDPLPRGAGALDLDRVAGRHVLVLAEQGRGDILQFVRYAPLLAARGARVALSVPDDLTALLRCMPGVESVVGPLDTEPLVDAIAPMMSLPLAFAAELDTVPAAIPYLFAPPDRVAIWRSRLGPLGAPRIGAMWMGSAHNQARSSMPLALLEPLLRRPGIEFHALCKDLRAEDRVRLSRTPLVRLHDAELNDFADTAALISLMDLVVTIDTSVAHLAGAMGKPVWILLGFNADFRWLHQGSTSRWYPTARLFRQPRRGDWAACIQAVIAALDDPDLDLDLDRVF